MFELINALPCQSISFMLSTWADLVTFNLINVETNYTNLLNMIETSDKSTWFNHNQPCLSLNFQRQSPAEVLLRRLEPTLNREARAAESACPENTRWTALLLHWFHCFLLTAGRQDDKMFGMPGKMSCVWIDVLVLLDPFSLIHRCEMMRYLWPVIQKRDRGFIPFDAGGAVNFLMQQCPDWMISPCASGAGSTRLAGFQSQGFWKPWSIKNSRCQAHSVTNCESKHHKTYIQIYIHSIHVLRRPPVCMFVWQKVKFERIFTSNISCFWGQLQHSCSALCQNTVGNADNVPGLHKL